jgi:hypothetical protein
MGTRNFKYLELGSIFIQEQNKIVSDQRTALRLEIAKALQALSQAAPAPTENEETL